MLKPNTAPACKQTYLLLCAGGVLHQVHLLLHRHPLRLHVRHNSLLLLLLLLQGRQVDVHLDLRRWLLLLLCLLRGHLHA